MIKIKSFFVLLAFAACSTMALAQEAPISQERKRAIDSLAIEKVRDLSKYITLIGSKETPFSEADRIIDRAQELFMKDAKIGVSTLARPEIKYFTVRKYMERLMALNYSKVVIDWYDIHYISDLEKQPDGKYVGVITIYQKFEGYSEEGIKYKDVTKKDITLYVEKKQTQISGHMIDYWDVMLGDIRVKETKP